MAKLNFSSSPRGVAQGEEANHRFPFDPEFQRALFRLYIFNPQFFLEHTELLKPKYFSNPSFVRIAQVRFYLYRQSGNPNTSWEGLLPYLEEKDKNILRQLVPTKENPLPLDLTVFVRAGKEFGARQLLRRTLAETASMLEDWSKENVPATILEKVRQSVFAAAPLGDPLDYLSPAMIEKRRQRASEIYQGRMRTGFETLDKILGGLFRKQTVIIQGRPSVGKSTFLVNLCVSFLCQGATVLYVSLEGDKYLTALRFDKRLLGCASAKEAFDQEENLAREFMRFTGKGGKLILYDTSDLGASPTVESLVGLVARTQSQGKRADVLVVDYADLLVPVQRFREERFGLRQIYRDLSRLAQRYNLIAITPSETQRITWFDETVDINAPAECAAKAFIADVLLSVSSSKQERKQSRCRVFVAKNRWGLARRSVKFEIDEARSLFREVENGKSPGE